MDRPASIGTTVSAAGHASLIAWLLFGGLFFAPDDNEIMVVGEVQLMTNAEFAALEAAAAQRADPEPAPEPETPTPAVEPIAPEAPEAPPPEPEPEPEPAPVATPVEPETPPEPEEAPPLPVPPVEEPSPTIDAQIAPRPRPNDAEVVAPTPNVAPEETPPAETEETAAAEAETEEPDVVEETPEDAAPEATTTEVITEETETSEEPQSSAPLTSARPQARPERPTPPEPEIETAAAPSEAETPDEPASDPVADALAEAMEGDQQEGVGEARTGPPLTFGDEEAFRVALEDCWNLAGLSTDALRTTVIVLVAFEPDGRPIPSSIELLGAEGGNGSSVNQAFQTARRAILNPRCARNGYPLPPEKYETWRELEIAFDPNDMRLR